MHCQNDGQNELLPQKTITGATSTMTAYKHTYIMSTHKVQVQYIANATTRSNVIRFVTTFFL
jgi:hypothetical protein